MHVFFSVQELELRKLHFDVAIPPGEIEFLDPKLRQVSPLATSGKVELLAHTLGEIRVAGHLRVMMQADCDRCLEPAEIEIDSDFDLFYRPAVKIPAHEEVEIDAGETEIGFYDGNGIELNDIVREYVLLSLPMQRVCSEKCKGICPVCGQNRNRVECACRATPMDDRWSALKNL